MTAQEVAQRLVENCDDLPIIHEIMKDFETLSNKDKSFVISFILGCLSKAQEFLKRSEDWQK